MKRFTLAALLTFSTHAALAGNLFDAASGDLLIPALSVNNTTYSVMFSMTSPASLVWGVNEVSPGTPGSRTAAVYDNESGTLWVPEIHINGKLISLNFRVSSGCGYAVCITADPASLQANGRDGAEVFTTPVSTASTFSCSSCHAISENDGLASDGLRRPGHPLLNAINRPDFKNGQVDMMLDAVNTCLTEWMNTSPWTETDSDWINLANWLEDQATSDAAEPIVIDIVEPPQNLSGGDAVNGREVFNSTCRVCHGLDGEGTPLAPKITETGLTPEYIATRIRQSGLPDSDIYSGLVGGIMPFWGADRLSDEELIDITAFVASGSILDLDMGDDILPPSDSGCSMDSSKIGQTASLSTLFHDVSGTVTIIDDCSIEITGFTFDGGGIDVQIYAGIDGQFQPSSGGFSLSEDLVGIAYENNTLRLTLPEGKSLDDFNSISVWCVAVGVSFGTGFFQ